MHIYNQKKKPKKQENKKNMIFCVTRYNHNSEKELIFLGQ